MVHNRPQTRPRNRTFSKIAAGGSSFLLFFSSAALGIMVLLVSYDVVLRNLFGSAMQGVSEYVSAWLMPATILFALAYAEHKSEHIQVTIIEDALSGGPQKALRVLGQLTAVLVSAVMTWSSFQLAMGSFDIQETVAMGTDLLPVWPIKMAVVLGWAWLTVQTLATLMSIIVTKGDNSPQTSLDGLSGLQLESDSRA